MSELLVPDSYFLAADDEVCWPSSPLDHHCMLVDCYVGYDGYFGLHYFSRCDMVQYE